MRRPTLLFFALVLTSRLLAAVAVPVVPLHAPQGMVVAGHPEVAAIGRDVLAAGGNAMDAAVAVSLALGVAEPYGSGLGGKLLLLYHDAATGQTFAVDGLDAASLSLDPAAFRQLPNEARRTGWTSVAVPGLPAALHAAHTRWGRRAWTDNVAPAITLAREGFTVQPKTRTQFTERLDKLRANPDLAALYLRDNQVPPEGARLPNPALAETLAQLASGGADAFYRGPAAATMVAAANAAGVAITAADFADYAPHFTTPLSVTTADGLTLLGGPPPATGAALTFTLFKVLENAPLTPPLRSADNLDRIGRAWRVVQGDVQRHLADTPEARAHAEAMLQDDALARYRAAALEDAKTDEETPGAHDATTHFVIVDRDGNVVSATQSLSLHFGAGVVSAGVVMNDSLSNFSTDRDGANAAAPGKRPRSTITPVIVTVAGRPVLAIGLPGAGRIPTAMLQVLLDHLRLDRPLEDAIGDARLHWQRPIGRDGAESVEVEASLDPAVIEELRQRGWKVDVIEPPGTGLHFGGINAIRLHPDSSRTGYADPRRTNAAAGH